MKERKARNTLTLEEEHVNGGNLEAKRERKISNSFQYRLEGPYTITKKFSPVMYETIINSNHEIIHVVNMKQDPVINELAPYLNEGIKKSNQKSSHLTSTAKQPKETLNLNQRK